MKISSSKTVLARWQIIISMVAFGTISIFVKGISLPSSELSLYRAVIACAVLLCYLIVTGRLRKLATLRSKLPVLFLSGAAMGFNWILLFTAYQYTTVALSTLAYYFAPTLIIAGSIVFFRERLTMKQILCFVASSAGLVLIIGVSGGGSSDLIGLLFGLGAALLYSVVVLLNKKAGDVDGITRTWVQFASAVLVLTPYVARTGGFHLTKLDTAGWGNLLILGVVHTGIIYVLYFSSLSHLDGEQSAILSYIDPAVSVLVSVFFLHESITALQLLGGAMIIVFAMLNEIRLPGRGKS